MRQVPGAGTLTLPGMEDVGLSPIRRQYLELKRRQPDAILLFRLGDFYETFEDDAHVASRVLDIVLTSREMGRGERLPMAGIPFHSADSYIARLIAAGLHVAIAEQIGVVPRNGIVPREIVCVLTPGMLLESHLLAGSRSNFLLSLVRDRDAVGLAYVDVSTGELLVTTFQGANVVELLSGELVRIGPAEVLAESDESLDALMPPGATLTRRGPEMFAPLAATRSVVRNFGGALESTGLAEHGLAVRALGGLLAYVGEARPSATRTLQYPRLYAVDGTMVLDRATRRNLDILESSAGDGGPSLLRVLDRTGTPMGARLLRNVLGQPLLDAERINRRLDAVEHLVNDSTMRSRLVDALRGLPDLERLSVRAGQQLLAPRECLSLAAGLERIPRVQRALSASAEPPLLLAEARPDHAPEVVADIHATIRDGATVFEEGVIKPGVSAELDQYRAMGGDARQWIADLEIRERERTGVRGARVGYNKVFGYYLEVTPLSALSRPTTTSARRAARIRSASISIASAGSVSRRWPTRSGSSLRS